MKPFLKILSLIVMVWSCKSNEDLHTTNPLPQSLKTTIVYNHIEDVASNLLSLDIYYNDNLMDNKPVVIYVHGGAWSMGDKANAIENKVRLFKSLNYIFVSVNYRLSPFPFNPTDSNRIKYPDHNLDIANAISWVYNNINEYGGNPNKIVLLGHSAGAHLVALTGTNQSFLENVGLSLANIKGIAVIDTQAYDITQQILDGNNPTMYTNAFGENEDIHREASPIEHITEDIAYSKFFIAKRGDTQRLAYANAFIEKLETHGAEVYQINGNPYTHSQINEAIGKPNETLITSVLVSFFNHCFQN